MFGENLARVRVSCDGYLFFFFFFFFLFRAVPVAYGSSQVRDRNGSHSCCPTPQL